MTSIHSPAVRRRRACVRALSTAALLLPTAALAQVATPAGPQLPEVQTASESLTSDIVVNGRRQRSALNEEQAAIATIDIVTTGDVAIHSQTSIADLAKMLPGISVSRDQGRNQSATGEAQFATIRGFDTGYNAYTLDGLRLPQTSGSSRAISLNLFSPFAIGGIAADKTPGAAKDADSIAGIIDLRTPTAFDFAQSFTRARVLGQVAGLALDREQEAFGGAMGLDAARRFGDAGQFGVYVAAYYEERGNAAESTAVQNDYKPTTANSGNSRANPNALSADGVQWNFYNNKIKRYGATGSVDYRSDAIDLFGRVNYATYLNTNTMNQTGLRNELTRGQTNPNGGAYNAAGAYTPLGINPASYFRTEDVEQELFSAQVGAKAHWNGFAASLEGAYADGRLDQPERIEAAFRGIAYNGATGNTGVSTEGVVVDLSHPKSPRPVLSPGAIAFVSSLDRPTQLYVQRGYDYLSESKATLKGSIGWSGDGLLRKVEVGGLYEDSDRAGRSLAPDNTRYRFLTPLQNGTVQGPSINQYLGYVLKDFLDYYPARPLKVLSRAQLDAQVRDFVSTVAVSQAVLNQGLLSADEQRKAAYATATVALGNFEIMPGIRYEDNGFAARYYLSDADGSRFVSAGREYDHLDPGVLAAWRPNDRIVVRAAARSSYARPSFDLIAGPTRISRDPARNNAIVAISQPNPDLKPVEAWSYDVGVDYYAGVGRYFQVAAYYKDLSNFVVTTATRTAGETVDGIVYTRPINGGGGKAKGVEASGRFTLGDMVGNDFLGNFGVGGNVTYQQTEATYAIPVNGVRTTRASALPQAPDLIYNAELFYADGRFRANLWYNHTGKVLAAVQDSQPDIYVQPVGEMNLGAAYAVTDNLELGLSARNLFDQHTYWATIGKGETYISNDRAGGYMKTGRVFSFSLTMKM